MINNKIDSKTGERLEFLTHTFNVTKIGRFTAAKCFINQSVYTEMVLSSKYSAYMDNIHDQNLKQIAGVLSMLGIEANPNFIFKGSPIENERYLIYRYIYSIFQIPNKKLFLFDSDEKYRFFCNDNNLEYHSQEWFNRLYIEDEYDIASAYLIKNSLIFQELYFPQNIVSNYSCPSLRDVQTLQKTVEFKSDFLDLYNILKSKNISCLYHFTDKSNIESIKKFGILSLKEVKEKNVSPIFSSTEKSRIADTEMGLDDYVRLSFVKYHPMMYTSMTAKGIHPQVIEINPLIALMPNVYFSDRNALKKGANIGGGASDLLKIDFEVVLGTTAYYNLPTVEKKTSYQAEILVKHRIGPEMILNYESL